jgi:superkiller protein 3
VEAYNNLGITYKEMGDLDKAIECFKKVLEIDDSYVKAYNNLGAALAEKGDIARAIEAFTKAISVNPGYANSYKNLAMAYVQLRKPKDAYDSLSRYHDLEPADDRVTETLAKLRIAISADTARTSPQR